MKIAIACGGPSSEHEVSLMSTAAILSAISSEYEAYIFYISRDKKCCLFEATDTLTIPQSGFVPLEEGLQLLKHMDLCFLGGIHGEFAEDGHLQKLLDLHGVRYSGSDAAASILAMDKYASAQLVASKIKVLTPHTRVIESPDQIPETLELPLVCKPNSLGSSVGVSIVQSEKDLRSAMNTLKGQPILLQEYIGEAVEISCGCLQRKNGEYIPLPPIEIQPLEAHFFDYSSKYEAEKSKEISPPVSINQHMSDSISQLAIDIHALLGCRLYSRSDFLVKEDNVYYLETNTLPGLTSNSLLPKEAQAAGMTYRELVDFLIKNSLE